MQADINVDLQLVPSEDVDEEEAERLKISLMREIRTSDMATPTEVRRDKAPNHTKAGPEALEAGTILVSLAPVSLAALVRLVQAWLSERGQRKVKVTLDGDSLELQGASSAESRAIANAWVQRHS